MLMYVHSPLGATWLDERRELENRPEELYICMLYKLWLLQVAR
jgi:hypothetical protein